MGVRRRGVLLIDLLVAMAIIGVVLLGVLPMMRSEGPLQLVTGSTMVATDIEYAQSRTLAHPSDPTIVVLEQDGSGYRLALLSEPEVAIDDPDGRPWVRTFGEGALADLEGCTLEGVGLIALPDDGPEAVLFDRFGRLEQEEDGAVRIVNYAGEQGVFVRAATGSVSILASLPEAEADPTPVDVGDAKVVEKGGETATQTFSIRR